MEGLSLSARALLWIGLLIAEIAAGLSILVSPLVGLGLSALIPIGLLLWRRPLLGYMLLVFFLPNYGKISLFNVGGTADITILQPAVAFAMLSYAVLVLRKGKIEFSFHSVDLPLFLIFLWAAISVLWTVNMFRGLQHLVRVMTGLSVYMLSVQMVKSRRDFRLVMSAWLALALGGAIYGVYETLTTGIHAAAQYEAEYTALYEKIHRDVRTSGLFDSPDMAGFLFSLSVVLVVTRFSTLAKGAWRRFVWFLIPLFMFTLVTTIARKSYLATGAALVMMFLLSKKMRWAVTSQLPFAVAAVVVIMLTPFGDAIRERVGSLFMPVAEAIPYRYQTWSYGLGYFFDSPLVGNGLGSFYELALRTGTVLQMPHNYYIWTLAEMGVVGMSLLLFWAYRMVSNFVPFLRREVEDEAYLLGLGLLCGLLVVVLHGAFRSFMLVDPTLWGFIGLCRAFLKVYQPSPAPQAVPAPRVAYGQSVPY
jgi:hypothetical protein